MPATVAVVTGPGHPTLLRSGYLIRHVVDFWSGRGVRFELTTSPRHAPPGDLAWQHLDATVVPAGYRRLLSRYPVVINGGVNDVTKRRTATHLVTKQDGWDGPVIVKTDLNFGGHADDWARRWRILRDPRFHALRSKLPPAITGHMEPSSYPIHASKASVPWWVWRDRRFVVQRFLAERDGDRYAIRRWFFFGECEFAYLAFSTRRVVTGDNHPDYEQTDGPPASLRRFRSELGIDYGKIDFAEVDGELVVYDVNPAVSATGHADSPLQAAIIAALVPGLASFLDRAAHTKR